MSSDYKSMLTEVFDNATNISEQQIDEAINVVLEQEDFLSPAEKLEAMINLLVESGDSVLSTHLDEEGAVGFSHQKIIDNDQLNQLLYLFPDIDLDYLINFCKRYDDFNLARIVGDLSEENYVRVQQDPLDMWERLKQVLPNADPSYLKNQARVLAKRPVDELEKFIENAIEKSDYPTMQEYLRNKEQDAELELYTTKFNVDEYLNRVPNPVETFLDPNRVSVLSGNGNEQDLQFALDFLYNQFLYQRTRDITKIFSHFERNLVKTNNKLKTLKKAFRHPRRLVTELKECKNIELLQEIAFLRHEKVIRHILKQRNERYRLALEEARSRGLLQTCTCCYDGQLIPEECYFCNKGCIFCKDCVKAGTENVIGKGETVFPCFAVCDGEFDYSTLKMVLSAKTFQGICRRRQIEEIRRANIDGLETCPSCDFCMIPNEDDKIFKCGNVNCMVETCRLCRHKAHIPLRCDEIEYDEDIKMRTFIENKMTEALLRTCLNCSKQFYKESGCNKMTCVCGARMCYVCGQAVDDYSHFNNGRCPLYTENLQEFHLNRVMTAALTAKNELGVTENPQKLKYDPTRGIERDIA